MKITFSKKKIIISIIIILIINILATHVINRVMAYKTCDEYMARQGIKQSTIKDKNFIYDFINGKYILQIKISDDPRLRYTYYLGETGYFGFKYKMSCIIFNHENVDVDCTNEERKYKELDYMLTSKYNIFTNKITFGEEKFKRRRFIKNPD